VEPLVKTNSIASQQNCWYVAHIKNLTGQKIQARLNELGIKNYLPYWTEVTEFRGKIVKKEKPVPINLIFLFTTYNTCLNLINFEPMKVNFMRDAITKRFMVIPEKQMEDFMFLLNFSDKAIRVINKDLRPGDRVRVIKGDFAGIEGELIRVQGHKRVVVRLKGLISLATTYIPGSFLERIVPEQSSNTGTEMTKKGDS
jgi:transcription antitermination factor NusG